MRFLLPGMEWCSAGASRRARAIKRCGMQINQSRRNNDGPPGLTAPSICIYTRRRSFCNFSKTHTRTKQRQTPFSQESKTCDFCRIPAHFITKIFRTWHGKSRAFYKLFFPFSTNKKKATISLCGMYFIYKALSVFLVTQMLSRACNTYEKKLVFFCFVLIYRVRRSWSLTHITERKKNAISTRTGIRGFLSMKWVWNVFVFSLLKRASLSLTCYQHIQKAKSCGKEKGKWCWLNHPRRRRLEEGGYICNLPPFRFSFLAEGPWVTGSHQNQTCAFRLLNEKWHLNFPTVHLQIMSIQFKVRLTW